MNEFSDLINLALRFSFNLVVVIVLVRFIYFHVRRKRQFAFAFFLSNILVFFLCHLLSKAEISMGFAFGLFAVFGILRYRTTTLPIKEMTYLFAAIAVALINGLTNEKSDFYELFFINLTILIVVFCLERIWPEEKRNTKRIAYERIDLIESNEREKIVEDLRTRTGLDVIDYSVRNIDFINKSADLRVEYRSDED